MLTYIVLAAIIVSSLAFMVILVLETGRALKFARVQARARKLELELADRMIEEAGSTTGKLSKMLGGRKSSFRHKSFRGGKGKGPRGSSIGRVNRAAPSRDEEDSKERPMSPRRKPKLKVAVTESAKEDIVSPRTLNKLVAEFATGQRALTPPTKKKEGDAADWKQNPMNPGNMSVFKAARQLSMIKALSPGVKVAGKVVPPPSRPPPKQLVEQRDRRRKSGGGTATGGGSPMARRRGTGRKLGGSPRSRWARVKPGAVLDVKRRRASMMRSAKLAAPPGVRKVRRPHRAPERAVPPKGGTKPGRALHGDATDWRKVLDEDSHMSFWYSEALGESVWIAADDSDPLPPNKRGVDDWERHDDDDEGKPFWFSASRGYSVWSDLYSPIAAREAADPSAAAAAATAAGPVDWEEHIDADNDLPFWYSPSRGYSVWTSPFADEPDAAGAAGFGATGDEDGALLAGSPKSRVTDWKEVWDDAAGRPFWYSESLGQSVWEDPTGGLGPASGETAVATDWVEHELPDGTGRRYWYSPSLDLSRWTDPHAVAASNRG